MAAIFVFPAMFFALKRLDSDLVIVDSGSLAKPNLHFAPTKKAIPPSAYLGELPVNRSKFQRNGCGAKGWTSALIFPSFNLPEELHDEGVETERC